jgi:glycine/D-amino acid oxidase-like deaminating enzyme
MQKTMIIVGAGIAGLSTGCYAQMNGYKTSIFELHKIPGGLCAAWTRKGYTFDISMHLLTNSKSGPFKKMWDELGVTKDQEFHYHDSIVVVEGKGKRLDFCLDRERFEKQMLAISPDDVGLIKEFNDLFFGKSIIDWDSQQVKNCLCHDTHDRDIQKIRKLDAAGICRAAQGSVFSQSAKILSGYSRLANAEIPNGRSVRLC